MSYFNETLPRLLIDAYTKQYTQAQDNSRIQNLTALPNNAVKAAWSDAGAQLPLVGLWPVATLISLTALAIVALLLKLAWNLARAKLCFFRRYRIHYGSEISRLDTSSAFEDSGATSDSMTRILLLPGNGAILCLALLACIASVTRGFMLETSGRLVWLNSLHELAEAIEFISLWTALLFLIIQSVGSIPLLSRRMTFTRENAHLPIPAAKLSKTTIHPLLMNSLLFLGPLLLCIIPTLVMLSGSKGSMHNLRSQLDMSVSQASDASTAVASGRNPDHQSTFTQQITASLDNAALHWTNARASQMIAGLILIVITASIEHVGHKRLRRVAEYADEAEAAHIAALPLRADRPPFASQTSSKTSSRGMRGLDGFTRPPSTLRRSSSFLSSSSASSSTYSRCSSEYKHPRVLSQSYLGQGRPKSLASSYRSYSASHSRTPDLYMPELPHLDFDLLSPCLMREETPGRDTSPYSPALAIVHEKAKEHAQAMRMSCSSSRSVSVPSLHRSSSASSYGTSLPCSDLPYAAGLEDLMFGRSPLASVAESGIEKDDYFRPHNLEDDDSGDNGTRVPSIFIEDTFADNFPANLNPTLPSPYMGNLDLQLQSACSPSTPWSMHSGRPHASPSLIDDSRSLFDHASFKGLARPTSRASTHHSHALSAYSSGRLSRFSRVSSSFTSKLAGYQGPKKPEIEHLRHTRAVDTALISTIVAIDILLNLCCVIARDDILGSKVLLSSIEILSILFKVLPVLAGVILSTMRPDPSTTLGWQDQDIYIASAEDDPGITHYRDTEAFIDDEKDYMSRWAA